MLGIGATTRDLHPRLCRLAGEQLVMVWSKVSGHDNDISAGDFLDWSQQSHSLQHPAAFTGGSLKTLSAAVQSVDSEIALAHLRTLDPVLNLSICARAGIVIGR